MLKAQIVLLLVVDEDSWVIFGESDGWTAGHLRNAEFSFFWSRRHM